MVSALFHIEKSTKKSFHTVMRVFILTSATGGFAALSLVRMLEENINVVAVIHSDDHVEDKAKYYKRKLRKILNIGVLGAVNGVLIRKWFSDESGYLPKVPSLIEICKKNKIPYLVIKNTSSPKGDDIEKIKNLKCDLGISLGSSYISQRIFTIPPKGMINIHHELLPEYKGAQSIIWQLYNGSEKTGYTIHKISKGIDAGAILYRKELNIEFKSTLRDTVEYNCARLKIDSAEALCKLLKNLGEFNSISEKTTPGKHYTTPGFWEMQRIKSNFKKLKAEKGKSGGKAS